MKNKKAVIEISFGTIFSIILIIIFIFAASYGIKKFLNLSYCSQIGIFKEELQNEIDKIWAGSGEYVYTKNFSLPSKITYICFGDKENKEKGEYKDYFKDFKNYGLTNNNFFFIPMKYACDFKTLTLKHIDIKKITSKNNPYCIPVTKENVNIKIVKKTNNNLVCIGENCD
ncbi:MAG: hypothetical protein QW117_01865 [Candidatus Pacearchaeota archaeon]